ncbi:MAG TPA: response regulator [Methylomirabilota bacterium]|nr:response regulator [Methylomirabilota bacterium]
MRILTVEDSATMRRIIRNTLKRVGYDDVLEAENGQMALAKLATEKIDFVITDWSMPEMNGLDFILEVRRNESTKHLPVLMITTVAEREDILTALKAGVNNYIVKPFDADTLKTKIDQILGNA